MTVKEKILERLEAMDEVQLTALERYLQSPEYVKLEEEFRLLDELAAPMSEEDKAVFEEATRRRPLFGDRELTLEPDTK